ncbi:MAG: recombinase family protein [Desulfobacterales bacterium]|nr:recombinase family protein [Desulfobacterales bacterium]
MDDFLYNLRAGKTGNFDRNRRSFGTGQNRTGKDYKKPGPDTTVMLDRLSTAVSEILPAIKTLLESIDENNKRLAANGELLARAEERKAAALENIASYLTSDHNSELIQEKKQALKMPEAERVKVLQMINEMRNENLSLDNIALNLEKKGINTFSGKGKWKSQTVQRLIQREIEG